MKKEFLKGNVPFFVFMYALGVMCAWLTLPNTKNAAIYPNLYRELFFDLMCLCLVFAIIPRKIRGWARGAVAFVFYAVAIIDVFCFSKYDSTLTPTMLLLVGETNSREASEFLTTLFSPLSSLAGVGAVLLLAILHILWKVYGEKVIVKAVLSRCKRSPLKVQKQSFKKVKRALLYSILIALTIWCGYKSWHNKQKIHELMTAPNIGKVEHILTYNDKAQLYEPVYRLAFSIYANKLAAKQIDILIDGVDKVQVDSCAYTSPRIVLIIGESFGPHHSQQYGYFMPTTPRQVERENTGRLVKFSDVIAPWNLTSFVFKKVFSMQVVGQEGDWCDYPLFPEVFRKAGYQVNFITNQFLPKAKEAVYDFSGGFFLNNPTLSDAMFSVRNSETHVYDDGLLKDYDNMLKKGLLARYKDGNPQPELTIFHLAGQHVTYRTRYPKDRKQFTGDDYKERRPELDDRQRRILSEYDNACLYNDSIVDQICQRFEDEDAIVIYMPDHGEECFEGKRNIVCRNHAMAIDYNMARLEFAIPFWVWCSSTYIHNHAEIFEQIVRAKDRRFMTDALPHMLLYLAGISSPHYVEKYNILSPEYDEQRPRILKGKTDYDKLKASPNPSKGRE